MAEVTVKMHGLWWFVCPICDGQEVNADRIELTKQITANHGRCIAQIIGEPRSMEVNVEFRTHVGYQLRESDTIGVWV